MKVKKITLLLITACLISSCGGQSTKSKDPIVYAEGNDPELEQAKKDALSTLDYFMKTFNIHSSDTAFHFSLKADFIDNGEHEHMWISLNKIENAKFQGLLGNEPQIIKNIKYGDLVTISRDQIEDWIILDTKTNNWEGGYSVKILQKRQQ
jgi:uncharacterized protein YegJ (DUF2314 family)